MIRYFFQGLHGPWYEVTFEQWTDLTPYYKIGQPFAEAEVGDPSVSYPLIAVYVDTATALQEDVEAAYPGLQKLIWFPDMRCGDCNGRLTDENSFDPDMKYPRYVHATGMMDRHGAWPVEEWED